MRCDLTHFVLEVVGVRACPFVDHHCVNVLLSSWYFYNSIFRAVQYHTLVHGPWDYICVISYIPGCALIRTGALERRVSWYFGWEETQHCCVWYPAPECSEFRISQNSNNSTPVHQYTCIATRPIHNTTLHKKTSTLASYPGPTQLSVTCSTLQCWAGPGNEATSALCYH